MKKKTKVTAGILSLLLISGCGMGIGEVFVIGVQVVRGIGYLLEGDESKDEKETQTSEN